MTIYQKRYYERNLEVVKARARLYYANNRPHVLEMVRKRAKDKREEILYKKREYQKKVTQNPELRDKRRETRYRKYYDRIEHYRLKSRVAAARRRVLLYGTNTKEDAFAQFAKLSMKLDAKCAYCGGWLALLGATVDHILPVSRGGDNSSSNLCLCCKPCNHSKNNKTVEEWRGVL